MIFENDHELNKHGIIKPFIEEYKGKVTVLTSLRSKTKEEIFTAVSNATDIAVETCFINGSENQFHEMVHLLINIKHSINVYIHYLSLKDDQTKELFDFIVDELKPQQIMKIEHHSIFSLIDKYDLITTLLDFSPITQPIKDREIFEENYKKSAKERSTGKKVKILGCSANGNQFKNLPIGQIVDVLDCCENDENKNRGLWVWGNDEPIKLVNDCGIIEYELQTENVEDVLL